MKRNLEYLLIGVIAGAALGFVLGLLFAAEYSAGVSSWRVDCQ